MLLLQLFFTVNLCVNDPVVVFRDIRLGSVLLLLWCLRMRRLGVHMFVVVFTCAFTGDLQHLLQIEVSQIL